jgi:hypothetical protein
MATGSGSAGCVFEVTFAPRDRGARVEVEDDVARADGHFGQNAFAAVDLAAGKIRVAKVAVLDAEDGNVGDRANSDLPQFGVASYVLIEDVITSAKVRALTAFRLLGTE